MNNQTHSTLSYHNATSTKHESYDDYQSVIVTLNDKWRIIECKDGIQWIIQYSKKRRGVREWQGRSYHRTSDSLKRVLARLKIEINPYSKSIIDQLPSRIENGVHNHD